MLILTGIKKLAVLTLKELITTAADIILIFSEKLKDLAFQVLN